ncbi:hypothetical protein [Streptomyces sp. NPDC059003]|uniref:hypothetical protein n=1 Tax=Streptomyces sp. NPDC059003 TaxID=3346691 RepID=UPI0036C389CD
MPIDLTKTERRFTIAYTDRETAGFEIRAVLSAVVRIGDSSNEPWVELRDSGLDWFYVAAVSAGDALLQGRAALAADIAEDWALQGIDGLAEDQPDTYFSRVLVTVALA